MRPRPSLAALGAGGITLPRLDRARSVNPRQTAFYVSPNDRRDRIYYESGEGGRGIVGGNSLAHELFGHYYLALTGVPYQHPESPEEAERRRRTPVPPEDAVRRRRGDQPARDAARGARRARPVRADLTGTVRDYIDRYAGAGIPPALGRARGTAWPLSPRASSSSRR